MKRREWGIDLNADLGEDCAHDEDLFARVSSASICCGAHAGGPAAMAQALRTGKAHGVALGAHPGYADREGFGRREQNLPPAEVEQLVGEQVDRLIELAAREGVVIRFLKPHGALYNQAQREQPLASAVVAAAAARGLPILGLPGSQVEAEAKRKGLRFVVEGFPERRYGPDGRLVPRTEPNAILREPAAVDAQVVWLLEQGVESLCIHGDDPDAVAKADLGLAVLNRLHLSVRSFA